ncbi:hypothetical protein FDX19_19290 [Citrobacter sp. wls619]|nr:hypothetical protein FDX19_19290 [Citrobacter sp. wls619]
MADICDGSSGFNSFTHRNDLMLSKTGFMHSDLRRWQVEYAERSLNVNGAIMRDAYKLPGIVEVHCTGVANQVVDFFPRKHRF